MRNITNQDLFTVLKIVRKANLKEKILKMKLPKDISEEQYGMLFLLEILESAPDAEDDIFHFLADIAEVNEEDIRNDEFELLPKVFEHLKGQKNLVNFLSQVFKLTT